MANRGTGAGGANTNYHGKLFEAKTHNQIRLEQDGYSKHENYLSKTDVNKTTIFTTQNGLKKYMKQSFGIDVFRCPDEAYITHYTDGRKKIHILEKKEQNVAGSVETKLWSGPSLKREYELVLGTEFEVVYGFCVSDYLKQKMISIDKKYVILNTILSESHISVLFGDDDSYFDTLDEWLKSS